MLSPGDTGMSNTYMILELRDAVVYGKERNYSSSKAKDLEFRLVV